jgi:endonuclease G, mitochondrial
MLKYTAAIFLILFAVSCKKESVTPTPTPIDTIPTPPVAVFTLLDASGNCNDIRVEGNYYTGVVLTSANRVVLQVKVTTKGTYALSLMSGNGYQFAASGTFGATGDQLLILPGLGAPASAAVNNFSVTSGATSCPFSITVVNPPPPIYDDNDHMYFGNPTNASVSEDSTNNYLMRKTYYAVSYSSSRGTPNWVSWHLYVNDLGATPRQDDFREDGTLPVGWYQVTTSSYSGSGFSRGHNTPSADRTSTIDANSSTFLMTNIIPQTSLNNQVWGTLEDSLRRLATSGYEVYIIMGNYGIGGTGNNGFVTTFDAGKVTVPSNIWKVAVIIQNGDTDESRVNANTRIIAVNIPNTNSLPSANWKNYRTSVDAIEAATGYNLLTRLPDAMQAPLEVKIDNL